ncbi:MAG: T9SS type A sorting domain-containing protein [Bacteroidia bacterium]|jgi:Secretion system C-terminal sorting domain|nr:T9SS type A sorting domain-containing protein [Bacteroidia bacterium]
MKQFLIFTALCLASISNATIWNVGPSQTYTVPSQVRLLVQDGDTIRIAGGVYANDVAKWVKKNLKFIGLGTGSNRTIIQSTGDIANGKGIWVFETPGTCDNPYIENIVFDGAQVSDANGGNGAGIRFQAKDITVKNCKFINCQNGILEGNGSVTTSNVMLLNSEFENNGYQLPNDPTHSGYEHHIYISASADTLWVENCYFHRPRGQANSLKTRAQRSYILYNLIDEEATGYGSWELNIAQGGLNVIVGNVIIQGTSGANHGMISYDAATNVLEDFYFVNNTVINKYIGANKYFNVTPATGINTYKIYNNIFASVAAATNSIFSANVPSVLDSSHNIFAPNYLTLGFTNPSTNDYSLLPTATLAINTGTNAGTTNTAFSLTPNKAYQSFTTTLATRTISGVAIDRGAYEYYFPSTGIAEKQLINDFSVYPNPFTHQTTINFNTQQKNTRISLQDVFGKEVRAIHFSGKQFILEKKELSAGVYFVKITDELRNSISKKIIVE